MKKLSVIIPIFLTIVLAFSIIGNVSAQPSAGDYIVAESSSGQLSSVTPDGVVTLITNVLSGPRGVAIDGSGNYIVTETGSGELSRVTPGGVVTLIAGSDLSGPVGVAIDGSGNYIVTEVTSDELSSVTPGGVVTLIASGFVNPIGVAIDGSGNYIVTQQSINELSTVTPDGTVTLITNDLSTPRGVAIVPGPTQTIPVGGIYTPMNKLNILLPYVVLIGLIGVFSIILVIRKWRKS